jgi:hypothetical protein
VQPIDPQEIARRMVFSLQYERRELMSYYMMYRFAFPEARNALIEQAEELQRAMLTRALAGKDAYAVHHPYPVPIPALFDTIGPLLDPSRNPFSRRKRVSEISSGKLMPLYGIAGYTARTSK